MMIKLECQHGQCTLNSKVLSIEPSRNFENSVILELEGNEVHLKIDELLVAIEAFSRLDA